MFNVLQNQRNLHALPEISEEALDAGLAGTDGAAAVRRALRGALGGRRGNRGSQAPPSSWQARAACVAADKPLDSFRNRTAFAPVCRHEGAFSDNGAAQHLQAGSARGEHFVMSLGIHIH